MVQFEMVKRFRTLKIGYNYCAHSTSVQGSVKFVKVNAIFFLENNFLAHSLYYIQHRNHSWILLSLKVLVKSLGRKPILQFQYN